MEGWEFVAFIFNETPLKITTANFNQNINNSRKKYSIDPNWPRKSKIPVCFLNKDKYFYCYANIIIYSVHCLDWKKTERKKNTKKHKFNKRFILFTKKFNMIITLRPLVIAFNINGCPIFDRSFELRHSTDTPGSYIDYSYATWKHNE